eukprot:TRINITY_DN68061_c0_g1_i1.p1 TRINITY_DN68061_c0_g1~~TRINITY_DN68061_c0_g1_i1.p1  ORF type:complete len:496 (+),score=74.84 TRINITY_DN68061_c0_g1_i1:42-1490(+)
MARMWLEQESSPVVTTNIEAKAQELLGCHDVEDTGLRYQCHQMMHRCKLGNHAAALQAMCPKTCNTCELPCKDVSFTTFIDGHGKHLSCSDLRSDCQVPQSRERLWRLCPVTCGRCPGIQPLTVLDIALQRADRRGRLRNNHTVNVGHALEQIERWSRESSDLYPAERCSSKLASARTEVWRIPQILHQTWKTDKVPSKFEEDLSSWRRLHPHWQFIFWNDHNGREFVLERFPEHADIFLSMSGIKQADVLRLVALYVYGGVYADIDVEAVRSFDDLIQAAAIAHVGVILGEENAVHTVLLERKLSTEFVSNAVMASSAGHPFWLEVLDEIFRTSKACGTDPVKCTGPRLIDRLSSEHVLKNPGCAWSGGCHGCIARLPFEYFSPEIARWNAGSMAKGCRELSFVGSSSESQVVRTACSRFEQAISYPAAFRTSRTFAVHHWQCSWCRDDETMRMTIPLTEIVWKVGNDTMRAAADCGGSNS